MMGMSQSLIEDVGSVVESWLKNPFNKLFFFWYFLPSAGFLYLQYSIVGPALGYYTALDSLSTITSQSSSDLSSIDSLAAGILVSLEKNVVGLIIIPLVLAIILSTLSGTVLRLFQGSLPGISWLLRPITGRNRNRNINFYQNLKQLRDDYFHLASSGLMYISDGGEKKLVKLSVDDLTEALSDMRIKIQSLHERIETLTPEVMLPVTLERVGPTALGNVLANAEEYPFERYGMDAKVFWPRLRAEIEPEKLEPLDSYYAAMSGLLNITLLAVIFSIEIFGIGLYALSLGSLTWFVPLYFVLALLIVVGCYRTAVSTAVAFGNSFCLYFDYYRGRILDRFGLKQPASIDEERKLWLKLGAFLRRGEPFYFPSEWNKSGT